MSTPVSQRARFLALVLEQMGQPYGWGKKGEETGGSCPCGSPLCHRSAAKAHFRQFDCSGLVTWAFTLSASFSPDTARHWRQDVNTDGLLARCRKTSNPVPGTLVLYGPSERDMDHVMVHVMPGLVVGACGGGSGTLTVADALRDGARVQPRPGVDYRAGRRFYVELPFADEQGGVQS